MSKINKLHKKRCKAQFKHEKILRETNESGKSPKYLRETFGSSVLKEVGYSAMMPQAMRAPEFPEGSVFMSSAFSCTTIDVPPLAKSDLAFFA